MEHYKVIVEKRIKVLTVMIPVAAVLIILAKYFSADMMPRGLSTWVSSDFVFGFQTGIFLGIEIILVRFAMVYKKGLKDAEKLKDLYIKENDERNKFIANQVGHTGFHIVFIGLAFATVVAGFFDYSVFLTLLMTIVFIALVKGSLKVYFGMKY